MPSRTRSDDRERSRQRTRTLGQGRSLPAGTVTFAFTDIEGSTRLLGRLRDRYADVLADHADLVREVAARWNGVEVDTQGDSFFLVFERATDAVGFAADLERALDEHEWPDAIRVRVRVGLHTGEARVGRTGYVGIDVHRAARIAAAAHGGQVVLSDATRGFLNAEAQPPSLRDIGAYRLKDLPEPEQIWQLEIDGMPQDFPPLRSLDGPEPPPEPGEPPFQGLEAYDVTDADRYFGREALTAALTDHLRERGFLAIVGASGSGKSSLARAGLMAAVVRDPAILGAGRRWEARVLTPTERPAEALAAVLDVAPDDQVGLLLVVDQFEELYTLCAEPADRAAFVDDLFARLEDPTAPAKLVLTLRADFYDRLAEHVRLREAVAADQVYTGPLGRDELRRAIEGPAERGGWEFVPGLVDLIVHDVGDEPGSLPLLSHALLELWNRRRGRTMTLKGYAESGGVSGAIARTADRVVLGELSPEQQAIARRVLLRLTQPGEGGHDTRRRASLRELVPAGGDASGVDFVLQELAAARLVTVGEDWFEVAHEALIGEWPTFREWLDEDREGLRLQRRLTEATTEWDRSGRDASLVVRGARLAQLVEWAAGHRSELSAEEAAFVEASVAARDAEAAEREAQRERELEAVKALAETESRAARRLRRRAVVLVVALVIAVGALGAAVWQTREALVGADRTRVREYAAVALTQLGTDAERAILVVLEAADLSKRVDNRVVREVQDALHRAVQASPLVATLPDANPDGTWMVEFAPAGDRFVTANFDGTATVWQLGESGIDASPSFSVLGSDPVPLDDGGQLRDVYDAGFSADGRLLATAGVDEVVRLYDATTGEERGSFRGHGDAVQSVEFHPGGEDLAVSGGYDGVRLWRVSDQQEVWATDGYAATFDESGARIVTVDFDGVLHVYDVATRSEQHAFAGGFGVRGVNFAQFAEVTPDGSRVVAAGQDQKGYVLDLEDESATPFLDAHGNTLRSIVLDPTGTLAATASDDGTARLWEVATGRQVAVFGGHTASVLAVAFAPDGRRLITVGGERAMRLWDVPIGREMAAWEPPRDRPPASLLPAIAGVLDDGALVLRREQGDELALELWDPDRPPAGRRPRLTSSIALEPASVIGAALSPDGTRFAAVRFEGDELEFSIWDVATGRAIQTIPFSRDGVYPLSLAFSRDGSRLLATGAESEPPTGWTAVWEVATGGLVFVRQDPEMVNDGAISPDNRYVATGTTFDPNKVPGVGGDLRLLDATTGAELHALAGHGKSAYDVRFSPDGRRVAAGYRSGRWIAWDWESGGTRDVPAGSGELFVVAWSRDGRRVATAGGDGTEKVWDAETGELLLTLTTPGGTGIAAGGLEFSPDGRRLYVGSSGGTVHAYLLDVEDLIALARTRVSRGLTADECRSYLGGSEGAACPGP